MQKPVQWVSTESTRECRNDEKPNPDSNDRRKRKGSVSDNFLCRLHPECFPKSEALLQIHPCVERSDLFFVSVEFQSWLSGEEETSSNDALGFLAPAWVINFGVHIGQKTVFAGGDLIPQCPWLISHKIDSCDRFSALESIFPGNHQADWRTVLILERFPVNARGK